MKASGREECVKGDQWGSLDGSWGKLGRGFVEGGGEERSEFGFQREKGFSDEKNANGEMRRRGSGVWRRK